jgi:hypothetical protein
MRVCGSISNESGWFFMSGNPTHAETQPEVGASKRGRGERWGGGMKAGGIEKSVGEILQLEYGKYGAVEDI